MTEKIITTRDEMEAMFPEFAGLTLLSSKLPPNTYTVAVGQEGPPSASPIFRGTPVVTIHASAFAPRGKRNE